MNLRPIVSRINPDLKEIFQICTGNANENLISKKTPYYVREPAKLIINKNTRNVVDSFDLKRDYLGVKVKLTENVRLYGYEIIDNAEAATGSVL